MQEVWGCTCQMAFEPENFEIDPRLLNDCSLLYQGSQISYLLHRNADVLWMILVPHTQEVEFYQLPDAEQQLLCQQINRISRLIDEQFDCDKINVATIGNMVSQMHIHIVGRRREDAYWPDVVWGQPVHRSHDEDFIENLRGLVQVAATE